MATLSELPSLSLWSFWAERGLAPGPSWVEGAPTSWQLLVSLDRSSLSPRPAASAARPEGASTQQGPLTAVLPPPQGGRPALDETEAMLADFVDCPPDEERDPGQPCS